ncbi:MFS transporter [Streptomyces europaeiscabiei]|uniref:hypothetical protein n=1 Tax=Streptomyces europaeiscabiei TaxID=146819 RepID=UPI0029A5F839|nr:hypothetical protein [Streptomyces europaeiscabiei]MDX3835619.1 hypothetical protein [Streptomyces europaeiscabiei]
MPSLFPRRPTQTITDTVNGIPVEYDIPDTTPIRKLPFNIDATLRRALFTLAIAMTIGAIIWGTVAIGSMLALLAPPWAAYLVAGVFDAGWAACLIAEWLLRYDSKRAERPRNAGVALLVVSMAAIIVHGALSGPWGWIVGIVGALVSAAAKGIWAIGMHTIRIKLDPKHEAYLRTLQQRSGTEQALALGERDRLLTEDRTVALKLALEARRPSVPSVVQDSPDEASGRPSASPDAVLGTSAPQPITSEDTRPDPLRKIADEASGPSDLVRTLAGHGVRNDDLVKTAVRLRPDLNADSIRRTAKRLGNTYL